MSRLNSKKDGCPPMSSRLHAGRDDTMQVHFREDAPCNVSKADARAPWARKDLVRRCITHQHFTLGGGNRREANASRNFTKP